MLVKVVPCALPRAYGAGRVSGLGMLVADPERTPLAYGAENVLGLLVVGLTRAGPLLPSGAPSTVEHRCSSSTLPAVAASDGRCSF